MADKYRLIEKPQETLPPNEILVKQTVGIGRYLKRAVDLFNETPNKTDVVIIKGGLKSAEDVVKLGELIKHRVKGLHQITKITSFTIDEEYEPLEEGLDYLKLPRIVVMLEIKLSKEPLDANDIGYQAPIDESEVLEYEGTLQLKRIVGIIEDVRLDGISRQLNQEAIVWGTIIATSSQLVSLFDREAVTLSKVMNILDERKFDPRINVYSQIQSICGELQQEYGWGTQRTSRRIKRPLQRYRNLATEARLQPQASQIPTIPQQMLPCKICCEVLELRQQLTIEGCGHLVCIDCQRDSINSEVSKMTIEHKCIQCPRDSTLVLTERDFNRILEDEMLKKRDLLMCEKSGMK